jgi:hypothetical protein
MKRHIKKAAKDKHPLISKLLKLKYRINSRLTRAAVDDKTWVMDLINDVRNSNITKLSSEDGTKCNAMWKHYEV